MGGGLLRRTSGGEPRPRSSEVRYREWVYTSGPAEYLSIPDPELNGPPFFSVVRGRHSRRPLGPLSDTDLGALLWYTGKTWERNSPSETRWEHRGVPSAGGRHPIDMLVAGRACAPEALFRYDPLGHSLILLPCCGSSELAGLLDEAASAARTRAGTMLFFAAQVGRTRARYQNPGTLIWRDAGALTASVALVAEAIGAACTPLGITGEPYVSRLLSSGRYVTGVGGCVVGPGEG